MEELVRIINNDIKNAEDRRDSFDKDSTEHMMNTATIVALKTVLFDMKWLKEEGKL